MKVSTLDTLNALEQAGLIGVTVNDFPTGFRLAARIYDLRKLGHHIKVDTHPQSLTLARYTLLQKRSVINGNHGSTV